MPCRRAILGGLVLVAGATFATALQSGAPRAPAGSKPAPYVAVVTRGNSSDPGGLDLFPLGPPWSATPTDILAGRNSTVRYAAGRLWIVNGTEDTIRAVDASTLEALFDMRLGPGSRPRDVVVVSPHVGYASLHGATALLRFDPTDGSPLGSVDLSAFADRDGIPEMAMMALDGNHLLVQIQRLDETSNNPVEPSFLAVVDVRTHTLVDADPVTSGIQGIELVGRAPDFKMSRFAAERRLFVSAPGPRLDTSDGIEEIDLDHLVSLGLFLSEERSIGDVGGFVMTSVDAGFAVGHTDITLSSHLFPLERGDDSGPRELYVTFDDVRTLGFDPIGRRIFFPDPGFAIEGLLVFDADDGRRLTETAVPASGPPIDLALVRPSTVPGEAVDLRVADRDVDTGELVLTYRPAPDATNHHLVFGPLAAVAGPSISGQVCRVGAGAPVAGFVPGPESLFFLVIGIDEASTEGTAGTTGDDIERTPGPSGCPPD